MMKIYPPLEELRAARKRLGHPADLDEALAATGIDALFALLDGESVEIDGRVWKLREVL
jgi:hypothetical protein